MQHYLQAKTFLDVIKESKTAMALWGVLLLFLSAQIQIPLEPVPITLQSMSVLLIGLSFSRGDAVRSVIAYIILGAIGLPMFSEFSSGLGIVTGTTGGYMFGFIAAVLIMNYLKEKYKKHSLPAIILYCLAGSAMIFIFGIGWLSTLIGFKDAIYFGFIPFIIPGILKALFLSLAVRYIHIEKTSL